MNRIEKELLVALDDLEQTVKTMRDTNSRPNLQPVFAHLDELTRNLPKNSDPDLLHFMRNKSYEKARLLLAGRNSENQRGTFGS
jgi:hypothetical protein